MFTQDVEYEVLVSCVAEDASWSKKLVKRLRDENIPTRLNDQKMPISQQLRTWISGTAPPKGQKLIAVCSQPYLDDAQSRQMIAEFRQKQTLRLAGERLLIPVMINGCSPPDDWKDLPSLDFSNERDFELRFRQLLEALDWQSERQDGLRANPARLISRFLGRKEEGSKISFANGVAEIYRMLDWEVNYGRQFDSASSELVISKTDGGVNTRAFVECHESALSSRAYGQIVERARQAPQAQRIVVSTHPVSADVEKSLREADVNYVLYTDLLDDLVPLKKYAAKLIEEFEQWRAENWEEQDWFIRPDVTTDKGQHRESALEHLSRWLGNEQAKHLAILGDLGTGKTTLMRFLAYELAKAFLADPLRHPAPVFIQLLEVRKEVTLKSIIIQHFEEEGVDLKGVGRFDHLVKTGRIVLLFDAFDEMADRLHDEKVKIKNLEQLLKPSEQGGKIVITSRTHYFKNYEEQVKLLKQEADYVYLAEFTEEQVQEYLAKARPKTKDSDWKLINSVYSLLELVKRPLFLNMVVEKLPLPGKRAGLNSANLYTDYVKLWVEREKSKQRRLADETRIGLMEELAWLMWSDQRTSLLYDEAMAFTERVVSKREFNFSSLGIEEVAGELCTASLLNRDDKGNFSFANRSFQEYFIASRILNYLADPDKDNAAMEMLAVRPLEKQIIIFLAQLDEARANAPAAE